MSAPGSSLGYGNSVIHYIVVSCARLCVVEKVRIVKSLDGVLRLYVFGSWNSLENISGLRGVF